MDLPTAGQVNTAGRYVVTAIGTVVATLGALHFISAGDATKLSASLTQIGSAATAIGTAVATALPIIMGIWGTWKSSPKQTLLAAASDPAVEKIIAPSVANDTPSDKVVAK